MKILLANPNENRAEWLALRAGKIGASQAAQVLGFDEHRSPLQAWMQIKGKDEQPDTEAMWAGRTFEKACAEAWAERERKMVHPTPGLLQHERLTWLIGTPDFLFNGFDKPGVGVLECKWLNQFAEGDWLGQPPLKYLVQLNLYLELTGLDEGALAAVFGGQKLHSVRVVKDEILIQNVLEALEEWHEKYIVGDTPPNPRGEDVSAWIKLNPRDSGEIIQLDDGELPMVEELERVRAEKSNCEKREEELKAWVATRLGTATAGVFSNGLAVTFKAQTTNHKAKKAYTTQTRVLRITRNFR
jgi:putative phage-type endonuclease